jgi:phosphoglycerate dehydrogenase-like enzyme
MAPRCFITPHSAGGHQGEGQRLVQHFLSNLCAFEAREPLVDGVWESFGGKAPEKGNPGDEKALGG